MLISCEDNISKNSGTLLGEISDIKGSGGSRNVSDIFGADYRIIKLTTKNNEEFVAPRKTVKKGSCFYALSADNIYVFDNYGEELSVLSKQGNAKDEYLNIDDFDLIEGDNGVEIVVCNQNKLLFYRLVMGRWEISNVVSFDGVIFDKIRLFEGKIIAKIRGDKSLLIADLDGDIISKFYDIDINNVASKPIQFNEVDGNCVYQNGATNSCVVIDDNLTITESDIVSSDDNILTTEITNNIYRDRTSEDGFSVAVNDYLNLSTFKRINEYTYLIYMTDSFKERYLVVKSENINGSYCFYGDNVTIKDDVLGCDNLSYLASIISSESEDSIILNVEASMIVDSTIVCVTNSGTITHKVEDNDNNFLIEFMI